METDKISSMRNPPLEVMVERSNKERFNGARDKWGNHCASEKETSAIVLWTDERGGEAKRTSEQSVV